MAKDKPIVIQKLDGDSQSYVDWESLHAEVNLAMTKDQLSAGAERTTSGLAFKVAYFTAIKDIRYNLTLYRIIYDDHAYLVTGYDDFKERHIDITLRGELYGQAV